MLLLSELTMLISRRLNMVFLKGEIGRLVFGFSEVHLRLLFFLEQALLATDIRIVVSTLLVNEVLVSRCVLSVFAPNDR